MILSSETPSPSGFTFEVAFAKPIDGKRDQSRGAIVERIEPAAEGANILIGYEFLDLDHMVPLMLPYGKRAAARRSSTSAASARLSGFI